MDARYLGGLVSRVTKGAKVVIVSNREPAMHERDVGGIRIVRPASGMVAALEPIVRATGGTWVAHGSGSADRLVTDAKGRVAMPPEDPRYTLRRVWLTRKEENGYYYGISNQADVLMLFYLFSAEQLQDLFSAMGYDFDPAAIPRNIHYYLERTSNGSTLSNVVHSWVLSRSDRIESWKLFKQALESDISDIQGGTTMRGFISGPWPGRWT